MSFSLVPRLHVLTIVCSQYRNSSPCWPRRQLIDIHCRWNSTSWDEFSRKWNKPVYTFLLRHVYASTMASYKLSRTTAMFVTFLLSACAHELVMVIVTHKFRWVNIVPDSRIIIWWPNHGVWQDVSFPTPGQHLLSKSQPKLYLMILHSLSKSHWSPSAGYPR